MRRVNLVSSVAMVVLAGALSACGGGGGSGPGGGVVTPPVVPPVVPPPVTPPSATLSIATPFAVLSGLTSVNGPGLSTQQASVSLRDPDTSSATRMRDLTLDGDEAVTVSVNVAGIVASKTFVAANQATASRTIGGRGLTINEWRNGADSFQLFGGLQSDAPPTGPLLGGYARLARFQIGDVSGYQVLGDRIVTRPTTGLAQFGGDSAGEFVRADGSLFNFLGRADIRVDFSASTIQGNISSLTFVDAAGAGVTPASGDLGFSFAGSVSSSGYTATITSSQAGAGGSVAGDFYDSASAAGAQVGGVYNVNYTAGRLTGGFLAGRTRAFNTFGAQLATYPSFARILTGAAGATSSFHRNSLDAPGGGGNHERVEITSSGTGRAGQTVSIAVDDSNYTIARTFAASSYQGPTGSTYYYWPSGASATTERPLRSEAWSGGLLAHPLYKRVNGAWTQATLAQAFEYVQTGVTPGVDSSLFMVSGPRSGNFTGSARFLGDAFGTYQGPFATPAVRVRGEMRLEVDFGRSQIRGALTDLFRSPTEGEVLGSQLGLGDVAFSAPLSSSFAATVTPDRANLTSLAGTVSGEFYGDLGSGSTEVGGVFALQSAQGALSGVYIGGRNPLPAGIYSSTGPQTFDGTGGTFFQAMGPATTTSLRWTRSGPGAGQSTATIAYTRDGLNRTMDVFSLIRSQDSLRFNQGGSILLEIVERVAGRDLNYAGLGRWNEDVGSSGWALQQNFVAFGQRATNMPTTGTATYTGSGQGRYLATGEDILAKGAFQLGANFSTGTVNGNLENNQAKYALSFTAAIAADGFSGTFITGDHALTGDVKGFFAGPGAAEVAGTFRAVDSPSGRSYTGGFVAAK